jgi:hypothetical protein
MPEGHQRCKAPMVAAIAAASAGASSAAPPTFTTIGPQPCG